MQGVIIVLLLLLVILAAAGVYLLYSGSGKSGPAAEVAPSATLVHIRNGLSGPSVSLTFESSRPVMVTEYDYVELGQKQDFELLGDPDVSYEEKQAIADSLRERGYKVKWPPAAAGGNGVPVPDFSGETDVDVLNEVLQSPYAPEAEKAAARRRLSELASSDNAGEQDSTEDGNGESGPGGLPSDGGDGGSDDGSASGSGDGELGEEADEEEEDEEEEDDENGYAVDPFPDVLGGYVDPLSCESVPDPHPEVPYVPVSEASVEPVPVPAVAGTSSDIVDVEEPSAAEGGTDSIEFRFDPGFPVDDKVESKKAIALMTFIAKSFRDNLISPELVAFAQEKLHLHVSRSFWTREQWRRANARKVGYFKDPTLVAMPVDAFDMHIRTVVEANKAAREKASPAPVVTRKTRPVSTFFDAHGGKNDLMWERVYAG